MRVLSILSFIIAILLILTGVSILYISEMNKGTKPISGIEIYKKPIYEEKNETQEEEKNETKHTVFVEEATATWCINCPNVAKAIHELYESKEYNFYYVTMIIDTNKVAEKRLKEDYNIYGYPTVFIDGGYKVVSGDKPKVNFANAIREAERREVPDISITVWISYNNETSTLETTVFIENKENYSYSGTLRVYLTEKISRWINRHKTSTGEGVYYHFGFIDFITNENIEIEGKKSKTINVSKKLTDFFVSDIEPEDIAVVAALFRSDYVKKYSYPDDKKGEFNAYYTDAVAMAELVEKFNAPPMVSIAYPEIGRVNIFKISLFKTFFGTTYIVGKSTILVNATDDRGIDRVQFYIDDKLVYEDKEEPFEYSFRKIGLIKHLIRKHNIKVVAYDIDGKYSSTYIDAITLFL